MGCFRKRIFLMLGLWFTLCVQRTTAQSRQSQVTEGKCEWEWRDVLSCGVCLSVGGSEWVDTCLHVNYIYLTQKKTALKGVGPFDCSCLSIIFVPEKAQGVWSLQTRYWHFIQESLPCFLLLASIKCLSAKKTNQKEKKSQFGAFASVCSLISKVFRYLLPQTHRERSSLSFLLTNIWHDGWNLLQNNLVTKGETRLVISW